MPDPTRWFSHGPSLDAVATSGAIMRALRNQRPGGLEPMARAQRKIPEGSWPRLMSAERGAAYFDVSVSTFLTVIASRFAPVSIGSRKLWDRVALDKWLDEQRDAEDADWLKGFNQ